MLPGWESLFFLEMDDLKYTFQEKHSKQGKHFIEIPRSVAPISAKSFFLTKNVKSVFAEKVLKSFKTYQERNKQSLILKAILIPSQCST